MIEQLDLDSVGKNIVFPELRGQPRVEVVMGIKAPRGLMFLFSSPYQRIDRQVEAIKTFMEQHSGQVS